ncbi:MAG TPA: hypothetical protein VGT44_05475 [Ktedonobacteraceae bacterium]|nr:hypothetical protein [Ktedonobacteraceae bacterium]
MMNTMMALWNRGWRGRLSVMLLVFFSLCISISLLVITAGSAWGALFVHRPQANVPAGVTGTNGLTSMAGTTAISTGSTVQSAQLTATATSVQIGVTNPCFVTVTSAGMQPTVGRPTPKASATRSGQPGGGRPRVTPTPPHPRLTPTPTRQPSPTSSPFPTPSASPSPVVTVTVVTTPIPTITPGVTPTLIPTPTLLPTPSPFPTITPTPLPTVTVTPVITPTDTSTPGATPTVTPFLTPTDTATPGASPTVSPALSPTVNIGLTAMPTLTWTPIGSQSSGGDTLPGNPSSSGAAGSCLGDTLLTGSFSTLMLSLQLEAWVSLCASLAGTVICCGTIARRARRAL